MIIDTTAAAFDPTEYTFTLIRKHEMTEAERSAFLEGFELGLEFTKEEL